LRGRVLDQLRYRGPATVTVLGERLGESGGSTSCHLRQLAPLRLQRDRPGQERRAGALVAHPPDGWAVREHAFREIPKYRDQDRRAADHALSRTVPLPRHRRNRAGNDGGPWDPTPVRSPPTEPFEGLNVLGVGALRPRGLQRDGDPRRDRVAEQLPEGLGTDVALADVLVPVLVAAARNLGVVSVNQLQPVGTHHLTETVQGLAHSLRGGDVVPRREQVR